MIIKKIKSIFHKEKWPDDKEIRFILSVKGNKKDMVMYYTQEQFNILIGAINLGFQVINMPRIITTAESRTTQEFIQ